MPKAKVKPRKKTKFGMKRSAQVANLSPPPERAGTPPGELPNLPPTLPPDPSLAPDAALGEDQGTGAEELSYTLGVQNDTPSVAPRVVGIGGESVRVSIPGVGQGQVEVAVADGAEPSIQTEPGDESQFTQTGSILGGESQSQATQATQDTAASAVSVQSYLLEPVEEADLARLLQTDPDNPQVREIISRSLSNFHERNVRLQSNPLVTRFFDIVSYPVITYRNLRYIIGQAHNVFANENTRNLENLHNAALNLITDKSFYFTVSEIREFVISNNQITGERFKDLKRYLLSARRLKRTLYRLNELCKLDSKNQAQNARQLDMLLALNKFSSGTSNDSNLRELTLTILNQMSNIYSNTTFERAPGSGRNVRVYLMDEYASRWSGCLQFNLKYIAEIINPRLSLGAASEKAERITRVFGGKTAGLERNSAAQQMGIASTFYAPIEHLTTNPSTVAREKLKYLTDMGVNLNSGPITSLGRFFDISRVMVGESTKLSTVWGTFSFFTSIVQKYYRPTVIMLTQTAPSVALAIQRLSQAGGAASVYVPAIPLAPLAVSSVLLAGHIYRKRKRGNAVESANIANESVEQYMSDKCLELISCIITPLDDTAGNLPKAWIEANIKPRLMGFPHFNINGEGPELQLYVNIIQQPHIVTRAYMTRTQGGQIIGDYSFLNARETSTYNEFKQIVQEDIDIDQILNTVANTRSRVRHFFLDRLDIVGRCLNLWTAPDNPQPAAPANPAAAAAGASFGKIMKPYRKYMVSYTGAELPVLQTLFGKLQLQENRKGLFVDGGGKKWYIYNWGKKV